jgi:hypothetical protein
LSPPPPPPSKLEQPFHQGDAKIDHLKEESHKIIRAFFAAHPITIAANVFYLKNVNILVKPGLKEKETTRSLKKHIQI